jgi:hypothetical protein
MYIPAAVNVGTTTKADIKDLKISFLPEVSLGIKS